MRIKGTWYIDVMVSGGVVQWIVGIPKHTIVRVIDQDSDEGNEDGERLSTIVYPDGEEGRAEVAPWPHDPHSMTVCKITQPKEVAR